MPPRVQTFAWRLLRQALPTGARMSIRSKHISKNCRRCGKEETDEHLFFMCDYTRIVWFVSPLAFRTEAVRQEHVEDIIRTMLSNYTSQDSLQMIFTMLWNIWKARNDLIFNSKEWKPFQVIFATNSMLQV